MNHVRSRLLVISSNNINTKMRLKFLIININVYILVIKTYYNTQYLHDILNDILNDKSSKGCKVPTSHCCRKPASESL